MKRVLAIVLLAMLLLALVAVPAQAWERESIVVPQVNCGGGSTPKAMIRYRMNYTVHAVTYQYWGSYTYGQNQVYQTGGNSNLNWSSGTVWSFKPGYYFLQHVGATFTSNTAPPGWDVVSLVGTYCVA